MTETILFCHSSQDVWGNCTWQHIDIGHTLWTRIFHEVLVVGPPSEQGTQFIAGKDSPVSRPRIQEEIILSFHLMDTEEVQVILTVEINAGSALFCRNFQVCEWKPHNAKTHKWQFKIGCLKNFFLVAWICELGIWSKKYLPIMETLLYLIESCMHTISKNKKLASESV